MHSLSLSKGAAHLALTILRTGLNQIDDIWAAGGLMLKLKPAEDVPKQNEGETGNDYAARVNAWSEEKFTPVSAEEHERDALKKAVQNLSEAKRLSCSTFTVELIRATGLHEKPKAA